MGVAKVPDVDLPESVDPRNWRIANGSYIVNTEADGGAVIAAIDSEHAEAIMEMVKAWTFFEENRDILQMWANVINGTPAPSDDMVEFVRDAHKRKQDKSWYYPSDDGTTARDDEHFIDRAPKYIVRLGTAYYLLRTRYGKLADQQRSALAFLHHLTQEALVTWRGKKDMTQEEKDKYRLWKALIQLSDIISGLGNKEDSDGN